MAQLPTPQITVDVIDRTTVRISGLSVAHALGYQVKIGTLSGGQVAEQVTPVDGVVEFADRSPRTVYYVTARALGDDEDYLNSDWAAEQAVTTGTAIDETMAVPQIGLAAESFTALKVTGLTAYKEYRYQIAESADGLDDASPQVMGSGDGTAYLMGLEPGTTYYVRFCLVDGAKCSLWSDVKSATTTEVTNTIEVTSGADSGAGTLRQAMTDATNGTKIVLNVDEITLNSAISNTKRVFVLGGLEDKTTIRPGNNNQIFNCAYLDCRNLIITGGSDTYITVNGGYWSYCDLDTVYYTGINSGSGVFVNAKGYALRIVDCRGRYGGGAKDCTLTNCTISGNTATHDGGGVAGGTLTNCVISGNTASGGGGGVAGGTLTNCVISGNTASGGGGTSASTLTNCTISGNSSTSYGGGVAGSTLRDCIITNNESTNSTSGGVDGSTCYNCIISNNKAVNGGGALNSTLENCLVIDNKKSQNVMEDINATSYTCTLKGCTVGAITNNANRLALYNTLYRSVTNTPTLGNANNLSYADAESDYFTDNFKLAKDSPAIAAGDVQYVTTTTDLAGNPRTRGGTVDVGCYQFQPYKLAVPSFSIRSTASGQCNIEYSVPEDADGFILQYADNPGFDDAGEITAEGTVISLTGLSGLVYFRGASKGDGATTLDSEWTESQTHYFDTTAPIVTVSRTPIEMTYGETVDFKAGVEVIDNITGEYPVHYQVLDRDNQPVIVDGQDTDIRTSGIPVGNYMLQISASDAAGNVGYADRGLAVLPPRLATPALALKSLIGQSVVLSGLVNIFASGWQLDHNGVVTTVTPDGAGYIAVTGLEDGVQHTFKVRALGDWVQPDPPEQPHGDHRDSEWSNVVNVTIIPPQPREGAFYVWDSDVRLSHAGRTLQNLEFRAKIVDAQTGDVLPGNIVSSALFTGYKVDGEERTVIPGFESVPVPNASFGAIEEDGFNFHFIPDQLQQRIILDSGYYLFTIALELTTGNPFNIYSEPIPIF